MIRRAPFLVVIIVADVAAKPEARDRVTSQGFLSRGDPSDPLRACSFGLGAIHPKGSRWGMSRASVSVFVVAVIVAASMASPAWALPLAAYWDMNEDSRQVLDSSGHNNNGTAKNVVQGVLEDINGDGQDETTYSFNGLTTLHPAWRCRMPTA